MAGNKKKIKVVKPFIKPFTATGEFTILEEPVVAVIESNKPAVAAEKKKANKINMDK